jgi:TonB family protein
VQVPTAEATTGGTYRGAGELVVSTTPPGAVVEIEGLVRAPSPLRLARVPAGSYVVRAIWPRGVRSETIAVEADRLTSINWSQPVAPGVQPQRRPQRVPRQAEAAPVPARPASAFVPLAAAPQSIMPETAPAAVPEEVVPARPLNERIPHFPSPFPQSREARIVVALVIDEQGRVAAASVRESNAPALDGPVLAAARRWRYEPATQGGIPVSSARTVEVRLPR